MFVINSVVADTRVVKEASTLAARGDDVTVIGMRDSPQQPERETIEGFLVLRVRPDPVAREIDGATLRRRPRAPEPLAMAWALLDYYVRAFVLALRLRAQAYHANDLVTLPLAWAAARWRRARVVYDAHELFTEIGRLGAFPRRVFRVVERLLIGRADGVITVNDSIAAELSRRYGIPTPVVVMNCPRTDGRIPSRGGSGLRARVGLPADVPIVLYQGMFMPHRGLENLVRAARLFTRARLVLMGWGGLLETLRALARREGVEGRVHFTPGVPLADLLLFTAGADLGAIPTRNVGLNNYYTSPNKLFEYCAARVPVVASRLPELTKIVEGLGIGRTFDPEKPEEIAAAVNGLLDDPAALGKARENVTKAAACFTWENESRKLLAVYDSLGVQS